MMNFRDIVDFADMTDLSIRNNAADRHEKMSNIYSFELGSLYYENKVLYFVYNPNNRLPKDRYYIRTCKKNSYYDYEKLGEKRIKLVKKLIRTLVKRDEEFINYINSKNTINKFNL